MKTEKGREKYSFLIICIIVDISLTHMHTQSFNVMCPLSPFRFTNRLNSGENYVTSFPHSETFTPERITET